MPRSTKLCKQRRFRGNQYSKNKQDVSINNSSSDRDSGSVEPSSRPTPPSASRTKIVGASVEDEVANSNIYNNVIVSIDIITQMLLNATCCKQCKRENTLGLLEESDERQGLACKLSVICSHCQSEYSFWTSHKTDGFYDVNLKCVYGLRSIGKGSVAGRTLFGMLDLPTPPIRFERYNPVFLRCLEKAATKSMVDATEEAVRYNVTDDGETSRDISIGIDGTWQKRGFSSLNGVVSVSSFETSKILDVEVLSKYCHLCRTSKGKAKSHFCNKNHDGSSGAMEVEGAKAVFARSEGTRKVRYKNYLGDGDSKGFQSVVDSQPYGKDFKIEKLECIGHVQKRVGGRLRRLRRDMKGKKLSDGLNIGGKSGRLTDSAIDSLQNYYGLAIRRNTGDLQKMRQAVWATFYHKMSTDDKPQHELCDIEWCKYKQCQKEGQAYIHKHSLDQAICDIIKPTFKDLSKPELLRKCLHGQTQNVNESFNSVLWSRIPKINFVGISTLKFGTFDAVISFNNGNQGRIKVLNELGVKIGTNCVDTFQKIDSTRVQKADYAALPEAKERRKRSRMIRKNLLDKEKEQDNDYDAGMF